MRPSCRSADRDSYAGTDRNSAGDAASAGNADPRTDVYAHAKANARADGHADSGAAQSGYGGTADDAVQRGF